MHGYFNYINKEGMRRPKLHCMYVQYMYIHVPSVCVLNSCVSNSGRLPPVPRGRRHKQDGGEEHEQAAGVQRHIPKQRSAYKFFRSSIATFS